MNTELILYLVVSQPIKKRDAMGAYTSASWLWIIIIIIIIIIIMLIIIITIYLHSGYSLRVHKHFT